MLKPAPGVHTNATASATCVCTEPRRYVWHRANTYMRDLARVSFWHTYATAT